MSWFSVGWKNQRKGTPVPDCFGNQPAGGNIRAEYECDTCPELTDCTSVSAERRPKEEQTHIPGITPDEPTGSAYTRWMGNGKDAVQVFPPKQPSPITSPESRPVFAVVRDLTRGVPEPLAGLLTETINGREAVGIATYGVSLQSHNGRDVVRDALEEALDLLVYLTQAYIERKVSIVLVHRALDLVLELLWVGDA